MRKIPIFAAAILGTIAAVIGISRYASKDNDTSNIENAQKPTASNDELSEVRQLLDDGDTSKALKIIHSHESELEYNSEKGKKWVDLFIEASNATHNYPQIIVLFEHFPKAFEKNEQAALWAANAFILSNRPRDYEVIREKWKGNEKLSQEWFLVDVDYLLLNNQKQDAKALLQSKTFPGEQDSGRLVRLALLSTPDDPKMAWGYLTEATTKDPTNADLHTYRAKLLESIGQKGLALEEYQTAIQVAPQNVFMKDQLAEFYLRNGQYLNAMTVWIDTLKTKSLDTIWIKTLFWNHVITPIEFDWKSLNPPKGPLRQLITYLIDLKPNVFWSDKNFNRLTNSQKLLTTQQATYWLRLIDDLQHEKEKEALNLLEHNIFITDSWNPLLEQALKQILSYRQQNSFGENVMARNPKDSSERVSTGNQYFDALNNLQIEQDQAKREGKNFEAPKDMQALLNSKEAVAAAFISTGWNEAGLQLSPQEAFPEDFPSWMALSYTQAINTNKGPEAAIKFAKEQKESPALLLFLGELYTLAKDPDSALTALKKLVNDKSEIGIRAAWLTSLIYIDQKKYEDAKETISSNKELSESLIGKETLARIALLEGDTELASNLYRSIEKESSEAKSYLARKAFAERDWNKAKELTQQLLIEYPNNTLLQDNLKKIIQEQDAEQIFSPK